MFIKTIKVKKPSVIGVGICCIVVALIAAVIIISGCMGKGEIYQLKNEADRQEFMAQMGWETADEYTECKVVLIPQEFNDVYENYNDIQKEQGFDLEKYKGKTVEIYSYQVYNYNGYENSEDIVCNLMICDGILIGGDVCCTKLDGFMQGLVKSET